MEENKIVVNEEPEQTVDLKKAKWSFSTLALGCFVILIVASILQAAAGALAGVAFPDLLSSQYGVWLVTFLPLYVIAVPVGYLVIKKVPKIEPEKRRFGAKNYIAAFFVAYFMMYLGNIVGTVLTNLISSGSGSEVVNPVMTLATQDSLFFRILVMVILAPVIEELIFRKLLIDRMRGYGEKLAVVISALLFALFHGNLSQGFYAFTIGLVLGYVYLRTGRLIYSALIHMFINLMSGVVSVELLNGLDISALDSMDISELMSPSLIGFGVYVIFAIVAAIVGLILFLTRKKDLKFETAPMEIPKGKRFSTSCLNVGMILMFLAFLTLTATTMISL